jgi:AraC-like DNA-binding protein
MIDPARAGINRFDLINAVRSLIRRHLLQSLEGGIKLRDLARQMGLSARSLQRRLERSGHSYSELLRQTKLETAVELLGAGERMTDIGFDLGYADTANFSRAFRAWTGVSPRAYRSRLRERRLEGPRQGLAGAGS